jgi:hypothetical protein
MEFNWVRGFGSRNKEKCDPQKRKRKDILRCEVLIVLFGGLRTSVDCKSFMEALKKTCCNFSS